MDDTMKKYEHRHLAMSVCEHKCNVCEKYVLPQAQAFGQSWSIVRDSLAGTHRCSWGRTAMKNSWDHTVMKKKTLTATG